MNGKYKSEMCLCSVTKLLSDATIGVFLSYVYMPYALRSFYMTKFKYNIKITS